MRTQKPRYYTLARVSLMLFVIALILFILTFIARIRVERELEKTMRELEVALIENQELRSSVVNTSCSTYEGINICSDETFKSWMSYKSITNKQSKQWMLQQEAITDKNYGFRMIDGYILVAMGSEYGPVGTKYIIQFEDKKVINAMIGDIKHEGCNSSPDGSVIEFIVALDELPSSIKRSGNFNDIFKGPIISITSIE